MPSNLLILTPPTSQKGLAGYLRGALPLLREITRPRLGRFTLGVLLVIVSRAASLVVPGSFKILVDQIIAARRITLLGPLILAIVAGVIVHASSSLAVTRLLGKEGLRIVAYLRCRVQEHVGRLRLSYFDRNRVGGIVARIMLDIESIRNLVGIGVIEFLGSLLTALFSLVCLVSISARLTAISLSFVAAAMVVSKIVMARMGPLYNEIGTIHADITGRLSESLSGIRVVKGYRAEAQEARVFSGHVQRLLHCSLRSITSQSWLAFSNALFMGMGTAAVIFVATRQILSGALTPGDFFTFMAFAAFVTGPVLQLSAIGSTLAEAIACLDRTQDLLNEPSEDANLERRRDIGPIQGYVSFQRVCFSYESGQNVLCDITFEAQPGTVTALVGPSGAGKSTIIGLLMAFYDSSEGSIIVDGADLSRVTLDSYRRQLGVVLQDTFLFDGTIHENVAFARPDASEAEVLEACRIAHVREFAERFPARYNTVVGERGVRLSGGQRQRISIARAILADPRILILDEATSSLDSRSEAAIRDGLSYLMKARTSFVIAHRLSTIHRADQILFVEDGRIVERGTHEELYASRGKYYDLYTRQYWTAAAGAHPALQDNGPEPARSQSSGPAQ